MGGLCRFCTAYFELPLGENLADLVSTLAIRGQCAKIRTGGLTADAFPSTAQIIRFTRTCLAANVPFKATAGLHHPIRCFKPLTYAPDAPSGMMHGFLNVSLAAGFAVRDLSRIFSKACSKTSFPKVSSFPTAALFGIKIIF